MPISPQEMMNTMLTNLKEKTGNTLSHLISVIENNCIAVHSEKDVDSELENYLNQGYNQA